MPPPRKIYPRRTRTSSQQPPLRRPPTQREAALEPRPRRVTRTRTSPPADTRPTLKMPPAYADPYFDAETMAMVDRERRALLVRRVIGVLLAVASLAYIIAAI